ncbi:MAG: hypothetical protein RRY07_07160 [Bacteroidaceae bacterium]
MNKKEWVKEYWWLLCLLAISSAPIIAYFVVFHNGLNNDSSKWGDFGSYLSGCFSIITSIILLIVTWNINKNNNSNSEKEKSIERIIYLQNHLNTVWSEMKERCQSNNYTASLELIKEVQILCATMEFYAGKLAKHEERHKTFRDRCIALKKKPTSEIELNLLNEEFQKQILNLNDTTK